MKKICAILLTLCLLLALSACGQAAAPQFSGAKAAEAPAEEPAAAYGGFRDTANSALYDESFYAEPDEAPMPEPAEGVSSAPAMDPEKIIYSASVNIETTAFDEALTKLEALVRRYGGFVESSSINGSNYYAQARGYASSRSADYVLRVPSDRFQELMDSFSELGNVPYSHSYSENITAQYYDVEARLTACRTQETRLLEMMEKAETVQDLIKLEDRLADLRYQIESLQSTLKNWDRQVSYSSISVSLSEVEIYTQTEEPGYFTQLREAAAEGFKATGRFFKELSLGLAELLPLLIVIAVVVLLCLPRIKKHRAARKAKKEAAQAGKAPET